MRHRIAALVLLFALCVGTSHASPPPPGGTTITLVAWRVKAIGSWAQVETWLGNRSLTIESVSGVGTDLKRPPGGNYNWVRGSKSATESVTITINETLATQQDKDDLREAIIAATSGVSVQ